MTSFLVLSVNDSMVEDTEEFTVQLVVTQGATILGISPGNPNSTIVEINDNDCECHVCHHCFTPMYRCFVSPLFHTNVSLLCVTTVSPLCHTVSHDVRISVSPGHPYVCVHCMYSQLAATFFAVVLQWLGYSSHRACTPSMRAMALCW